MILAIAQFNPRVGDVAGNVGHVARALRLCEADPPDLLVFPELFLTGYPPRDLLEKRWFIDRAQEGIGQVCELSARHPRTAVLLGAPRPTGSAAGRGLFNAAVLVEGGRVVFEQPKTLLPTYDIFDECRYFDPAVRVEPVRFRGRMLGISVCEDAWNSPGAGPVAGLYSRDPMQELATRGAELFINLSASPYCLGKDRLRERLVCGQAARHGRPFVYVNQVGGNDELIFDGASLVSDARGRLALRAPSFGEFLQRFDPFQPACAPVADPAPDIAQVHDGLVRGIRDYFDKCGFSRAVIGLSGGIDSALSCCLLARAIGPGNVLGISMPSAYSSAGSVDDSRELARALGVRFEVVSIQPLVESYRLTLSPLFAGAAPNIAEENIQARIRGNLLMAVSNKFGHLVVTTGNKSELAVGYCTLYGDMSGGLSVISDLPKMMVYALARHVNRPRPCIPEAVFTKPPSAELRPNQTDQDTLPPYPELDAILQAYVEEDRSLADLVKAGFREETVRWVISTINRSEYKRRQAAPGLKITSKAFGSGRRMPVAAVYPL